MRGWRHYAGTSISVAFLAGVILIAGSSAAIAQGTGRSAQPSQWWPGTPFATSDVVLNASGVQKCEVSFAADPGSVVLLTIVAGSFNVPPGGDGSVAMKYKLPDGSTHIIEVPMHATAKSLQPAGLYDQFTGSLLLGGFPVIEAQTCLTGANSTGQLDFVGFTVVVPQQ